jgi:hypothetical protein
MNVIDLFFKSKEESHFSPTLSLARPPRTNFEGEEEDWESSDSNGEVITFRAKDHVRVFVNEVEHFPGTGKVCITLSKLRG